MSASFEHIAGHKVYYLNLLNPNTNEVRQIPYGLRSVAEEKIKEFLRGGICAWLTETDEDIEFNSVQAVQSLEKWLVASGDIG